MRPDRFRVFTKRGAALGVLSVMAAGVIVLAAAAAVGLLLLLVF